MSSLLQSCQNSNASLSLDCLHLHLHGVLELFHSIVCEKQVLKLAWCCRNAGRMLDGIVFRIQIEVWPYMK